MTKLILHKFPRAGSGLALAVQILFACVPPAAADESIPITGFHINQEISALSGVLVSRPDPQDEEISKFIALHQIRSLEDYARWLKENIAYRRNERPDRWATPKETLAVRNGDCEDYAFLNTAVAQVLGYRPHVLALVRNGRAHAICTFKHDKTYVWFDNAKLIKTEAATLDEFARWIMSRYNYSSMLELNIDTRKWQVLYSPRRAS
ncbi:MAG: transglutaminase-like domain-containing protein [Candidatus Omnitrophota bacterium]|nr:transglutaminase-like domain-containing protein [Candidatus Omnitrophota bacterium]MDZ4242800.1 transglutaminase-like domain-containing protein [Candidatus Omnitrophota bacterium]